MKVKRRGMAREKAQAIRQTVYMHVTPELAEARQKKQVAIKAMYELKKEIKEDLKKKGKTLPNPTKVIGAMPKSLKKRIRKEVRRHEREEIKLVLENKMKTDVGIRQLSEDYKDLKKECRDLQKEIYSAAVEAQSSGSSKLTQQRPRQHVQRKDPYFGRSATLMQQGPRQQVQRKDRRHVGGSATLMQRGEQHAPREDLHVGGSATLIQEPKKHVQRKDLHVGRSATLMQQGPRQHASRKDLHIGRSASFVPQEPEQRAPREDLHVGKSATFIPQEPEQHVQREDLYVGGSTTSVLQGPGYHVHVQRREDLHFGSATFMQQVAGLYRPTPGKDPNFCSSGGYATFMQQVPVHHAQREVSQFDGYRRSAMFMPQVPGQGQYPQRVDPHYAMFQQRLDIQSCAYVEANRTIPTVHHFPVTMMAHDGPKTNWTGIM